MRNCALSRDAKMMPNSIRGIGKSGRCSPGHLDPHKKTQVRVRTACHTEVATDEVRDASRTRAPDSPVPGEYKGEQHAREQQHRRCWLVRSETMDDESVEVRTTRQDGEHRSQLPRAA
jgi:hypothetical protein